MRGVCNTARNIAASVVECDPYSVHATVNVAAHELGHK